MLWIFPFSAFLSVFPWRTFFLNVLVTPKNLSINPGVSIQHFWAIVYSTSLVDLCGRNFRLSICHKFGTLLFLNWATFWVIVHFVVTGKTKFTSSLGLFIFVETLVQCGFSGCLKALQCPGDEDLGLESVHLCPELQPDKSILLLIWIPQPVSGAQIRLPGPVSGIPVGFHLDFCQWLSGDWLTRYVIPENPFDKTKCLPLWFAWWVLTFSGTSFGPDAEVSWKEISASTGTSLVLVLMTSSQGHQSPQQNEVFLWRLPLCPL